MTFQFLGPDPLEKQVTRTLERLADGQPPSQIETSQVDVKEEPGRRRGSLEGHNDLVLDLARRRGRVSSTEVADLIDVSIPTAGKRLAALAGEGMLVPSRPNGTGRGFH